jgi:hypothetical protein
MQPVLALLASHKHKESDMGQFKPMVKMETTEPSVILKLKKGGHVNMKKGGKAEAGHKKMAMGGGAMEALAGTPALVGRPAVNAPVRAPGKPSMAARRKAMMAKPAMPMGNPSMPAPMKKGGKAEGGKMDTAQDKAMIKKAFKQHDLQEHKGGKGTSLKLKKGGKMATGGVSLGNAGGFKTGGVALGNAGGFKTGGVTLGNAGGFKAGGKSSKKAYATGGTVNSGKPVAMPQGAKKPSTPVSINQLSGTFKKGGSVTPAEGRLRANNRAENSTAMKQAKAQSNDVYSKYQRMADGGKPVDMSKGAYDASKKHSMELEDALNPLSMVKELYGKARDAFRGQGSITNKERDALEQKMPGKFVDMKGMKPENFIQKMPDKSADMKGMKPEDFIQKMPDRLRGQGAITETERSVTVSPAGKKRGGVAC